MYKGTTPWRAQIVPGVLVSACRWLWYGAGERLPPAQHTLVVVEDVGIEGKSSKNKTKHTNTQKVEKITKAKKKTTKTSKTKRRKKHLLKVLRKARVLGQVSVRHRAPGVADGVLEVTGEDLRHRVLLLNVFHRVPCLATEAFALHVLQ